MPNPINHRFAIVVLAALLGGCAWAPGMHIANTPTEPALGAWYGQQANPSADAAPPGKITPITPSLIRAMRKRQAPDVSPEVKKLFDLAKPYQIGPGDVLNIVVWDHPELTMAPAASGGVDVGGAATVGNGFNVNSQGLIQFPYAGTLQVAGLTEFQARDLLSQRLAKYIKDPQVTVRIQAYRSGRIYIDGEVRNPGLQALNDIPMTLPEAIGRAGGVTALGDRSAIAITRDNSTTMVNLLLLVERGINPSNILLRNGDLVRVLGREESKVFVMGEVLRPGTQTLRNGRLSLYEAVGEAGGVSQFSGDPRQIFVVRATNTDVPEIYHLDASSPTALAMTEGFALQARDVVYVDPVPLILWNRVISLILPSATAVGTTTNALKN